MPTAREIEELQNSAEMVLNSFDEKRLKAEKASIEEKLSSPDIWNEVKSAGKLNQQIKEIEHKLSELKNLRSELDNLQIAVELNEELQIEIISEKINKQKQHLENQKYFTGKFDYQGALLSIHAGAGGIDAQDWASMLASMYQAFFQLQDSDFTIVSISTGEEGGLKSISIDVKGQNIYGFLKEEAGVHRLVRQSPFNSGHTRETSFALIEVIPNDLESEFESLNELDEKDLKWDYFMAGGKGGQSVNTTYSAVRVTHLPTGLTVVCQNERNQQQNKQMALKYLKNKLLVVELQKRHDLKEELKGQFQSAEWGSQIRNYVLHPYKLVKDLRSGWETTDVSKVLENGEILDIIWSVKRAKAEVG